MNPWTAVPLRFVAAVSTTEAWIEAVVLLALCALTLAGLVRTVRRDTRASRQAGAGARGD